MKTISSILSFLVLVTFSIAQESAILTSTVSSDLYEIGGIKVIGAKHSDPQAVIALSGLEVGDKIKIPGLEVSQAMKALWGLRLFTDVQIYKEKTIDKIVFLEIHLEESPRLKEVRVSGLKKMDRDAISKLIQPYFIIGSVIGENETNHAKKLIEQHFVNKGFPDVKVTQKEKVEEASTEFTLIYKVEKGKRVRIWDIQFKGNEHFSDSKLAKQMTETNSTSRILASSKLAPVGLKKDKAQIIDFYKNHGFLDAKILKDRIWRNTEGYFEIEMQVEEGEQYFFGEIEWKGNSVFSDQLLDKVAGIKKGTVYSPKKLEERLQFSLDGSDVSSIYMDNGYLFFQMDIVEKSLENNIIDLEIRMMEGPQATIGKVSIAGNTTTNEAVIRREVRTKPGDKFSRSAIIRSQREIINLGYFNPQNLGINTKVNPEDGTVDIEYTVEEQPSQQLEFSGSWGGKGTGVIGTLGLNFSNFSVQKLFKPSTWDPLPYGDGQQLSLRLQSSGKTYQSYNFSFSEPWLGGKKPNRLSVSGYFTRNTNGEVSSSDAFGQLKLLGATISLGTRLKWPDDNFISSTAINLQRYSLENWSSGLFQTDDGTTVSDGNYNNFSITQTIARSTVNHPIFPTKGSHLSLSLQFTPPYSLFKKEQSDDSTQDKYRWLEYHKWRFDAEKYLPLSNKLVLKASANFGFLGNFNSTLGTTPFERFQIGGDVLDQRGSFTGTDFITLRGYDIEDLENNWKDGQLVTNPIFNKYTLELRYLLTSNPMSTAYLLAFAEAGNSWQNFDSYRPLDLKRTVGMGFRVHLPMFGLLGIDYGVGFDKPGVSGLKGLGRISLILGFE